MSSSVLRRPFEDKEQNGTDFCLAYAPLRILLAKVQLFLVTHYASTFFV